MLSFEEKIAYFEHCLENQNRNYHDTMKDEIYLYFFELENGNFDFLNTLKTQDEIRNKVDFLQSDYVKANVNFTDKMNWLAENLKSHQRVLEGIESAIKKLEEKLK